MNQPIFLRIFSGQTLVAVKQFDTTQVVFGREAQVDVDLSDPDISNIHAMIEERGGDYYICDLGSKTGTVVNSKTVLDTKLQSGDILEFGKFRIEFYIGIPKPKTKPAKTVLPTAPERPPSEEQIQHAKEDTLVSDPPAAAEPPSAKEKLVDEEDLPPKEEKVEEPENISAEEADIIEEENLDSIEESQPPAVSEEMQVPKVPRQAPPIHENRLMKSEDEGTETTVDPAGQVVKKKRASKKRRLTYAPPSSYGSLDEVVRPGKGLLMDVMIAWGDRVIETHRVSKEGQINIGSHPKNDIVLPMLDGIIQSQPFLKGVQTVSQVYIPKNKKGYMRLGKNQKISFDQAAERGRATNAGNFWVIELQQEELICIDYGNALSVYVTHAQQAPEIILGGLTTAEIMSICAAIVLAFLMYFISNSWVSPEKPEEEKEKNIRVTRFEFKRNEPIPQPRKVEVKENAKPAPIKTPSKVKTPKKETRRGKPGKAAELRPNKNRLRDKMKVAAEKKATPRKNPKTRAGKSSTKKGSKGTKQKKAPQDLGLAGFFAKNGAQNQLNKVVKGKNQVLGESQKVTGAGGGSGGSGADAGLLNVSKGGKGEATIGKQQVDTKGKSGGLGDYGEGGLGQKGTTSIEVGGEGAEFEGEIDKEAVRRVIRANLAQVRACYEEELNKDLSLYGKVMVSWEIQAGGRVGRAFVKSSTLKNRNVEKCIVRRLKTWRFPIPPAGATAAVSYPFVFTAR